jgi:CRISPR system Cascade subunit CasA
MTPSFNLVDEPWIPCLFAHGDTDELCLYDALARAHEIREIFDSSPLVVTALHRLLLAILHRNFGPESLTDWKKLWEKGHWNDAPLCDYFKRWRHRFDLFHSERPFYQVPEMKNEEGKPIQKHPVHLLALEAAAGNNPTLFDHSYSMAPGTFSPARTARYLLARQAYSIGFGKSNPFYFKDSPLIRGFSVFTLGGSLWETLTLNLVAYNAERPIPRSGDDLPAWEKETLPEPNDTGNPIRGYVDYLTWQSRRVHLFPEGNPPVVRWCQVQQNLMLPEPPPLDPFKCHIPDKGKGWRPRGIVPERAVWRDSHTLFQATGQSLRPEVFDWAGRIWKLRESGEISAKATYGFLAVGIATDIGKAANILLWRQERLPLPLAYLEDRELLGKLKDALDFAEDVSRILELHLRVVALTILDPKADPERHLRDIGIAIFKPEIGKRLSGALFSTEVKNTLKTWSPTRLYFSQLEAPFRQLLVELPEDRDEDEDGDIEYGHKQLPQWGRVLRQAALDTFNTIATGLGESPRALKAVAQVEDKFQRILNTEIQKLSQEVTIESEE